VTVHDQVHNSKQQHADEPDQEPIEDPKQPFAHALIETYQ